MKQSLGAKAIIFPTPTWVIGCYDTAGQANAMVVAWGGPCCSAPPSVAISLRPATHSYAGIMEHRAFTVNIPGIQHLKQTDYLGITSGADTDKFAAAGLTAVPSELVDAPYIAEFPWVLECKLTHTLELGRHTQFIGEILDVKVDAAVMGAKLPEVEKVDTFLYDVCSRSYYGIGERLGKAYTIGKELQR